MQRARGLQGVWARRVQRGVIAWRGACGRTCTGPLWRAPPHPRVCLFISPGYAARPPLHQRAVARPPCAPWPPRGPSALLCTPPCPTTPWHHPLPPGAAAASISWLPGLPKKIKRRPGKGVVGSPASAAVLGSCLWQLLLEPVLQNKDTTSPPSRATGQTLRLRLSRGLHRAPLCPGRVPSGP